jgi:predicted Zn-ribbon and HTH transcriptional regulator
MKRGKCPKCESSQIYSRHAGIQPEGAWLMQDSTWGGMSVNKSVSIDTYLCIRCGFIENYLSDASKVPKVKQYWDLVG